MDKTLEKFLEEKSIALDVAKRKGIRRLNDGRIEIPVYDENGKKIFSKFRRDPAIDNSSNTPKYTYETGATAAIYNLHKLKSVPPPTPVFICEGELKALCLESFSFAAVSSTGGVGTFREEWVKYFEGRDVYIVLDNDIPGIKGAFSLQQKIPWAKIIFLPLKANFLSDNWGKDITDFACHNKENFLVYFNKFIELAENWYYDIPREFKTKDEAWEAKRNLEGLLDRTMMRISEAKSKDPCGENPYEWLEIYKDRLMWEIGDVKNRFWRMGRKNAAPEDIGSLQKAKEVPISDFIKFNTAGFARSVWNPKDSNPSMKYYKNENRVYDYSSGRGGDAVDVAQVIWGVSFKEAVEKLTSGKF